MVEHISIKEGVKMINVRTLKQTKSLQNSFKISNEKFEQMLKEAQGDVESGNLCTHADVINVGLEFLENRMSELSEKDQFDARKFINTWRR